MAGLIWRTVAAVLAGLVALVVLAQWLAPGDDAPTPYAGAHYLEESWPRGALEGGWKVRRIEPRPGRVLVVLGVRDGPAAGLLRMPDGARWTAFGPACPEPTHPVWDRLAPEVDIHLRPVSDAGEVIIGGLSCRYWNRRSADS